MTHWKATIYAVVDLAFLASVRLRAWNRGLPDPLADRRPPVARPRDADDCMCWPAQMLLEGENL